MTTDWDHTSGDELRRHRDAFLADHDIGAFYRMLVDNGWSQHGIAKTTKTQQSQISEIIKGRRVIDYQVLVRIVQVQVAKVRDLTRRLGEAGRAFGSDPEV